jgi:hypothetical protein
MAKSSRSSVLGGKDPISNASLKDKTAKGVSGKNLCALGLLLIRPLLFIRGGCRERKFFIRQKEKMTITAERSGRSREDEVFVKG